MDVWDKMVGRIISVLIVGKDNKNETFTGILEEISGKYLIISPNDPNFNFNIETFLIEKDFVKSVWVYKKECK